MSDFLKFLSHHKINQIFIPNVLLDLLSKEALSQNVNLPSLKEVIVAGEQLAITPRIKDFFHQNQQTRLINHYGPAETHVVTAYSMPENPINWPELPPIGQPIHNTQIYLLDKYKQPVPTGVIGEIYVVGTGLSWEYLNQPQLTQEKFITLSFSDKPVRPYKTGDQRTTNHPTSWSLLLSWLLYGRNHRCRNGHSTTRPR